VRYALIIATAIALGLATYFARPRPLSPPRTALLVVLGFVAAALVLVQHHLDHMFDNLTGIPIGTVH